MVIGCLPAAGVFAVHLSDGVLAPSWLAGGYALAAALVGTSLWRIGDRAVVRVGLFTAAFFVASQVHLPVGVGTVHLMLNGVVGVVLRRFAPLAIAVGLFLQALLFGHGGPTALGVNICVLSLPALAAGYGYPLLRRATFRGTGALLAASAWLAAVTWFVVAAAATEAVVRTLRGERRFEVREMVDWWAFSPPAVAAAAVAAAVGVALLRRVDHGRSFACGVVIGLAACLMTVLLNAGALALGGQEDWRALVGAVLVAHMPVIAAEAVGTGVVVSYLERVKPEWLDPAAG